MQEILLARRVDGQITAADFEARETAGPSESHDGLVGTRTTHISLDPYLALRMRKGIPDAGNGPPYPIVGRTIGEVMEPGASDFRRGDHVLGFGRWASEDWRLAADLRKVDLDAAPPEAHLGIAGHSGFTAWLGVRLAGLRSGECFVVSGAAGAVGSVAGQLAKRSGCRVVGIAGGREKASWVVEALGFDACIDHRRPDFAEALAASLPGGADIHFENVGAAMLDPMLGLMKRRGRMMLCGLMQHYQNADPVALRNFRAILERSIRIEPFSIYDHEELASTARNELIAEVGAGGLRFKCSTTHGLDHVPEAFVAMLEGRGIGKHIAVVG